MTVRPAAGPVLSDSAIGAGAEASARAGARDAARFRRLPGFDEIATMDAAFRDHHFSPHTHDELMLGLMYRGVKRFACERHRSCVGPGGLSLVNPGEMHTGGPAEGERIVYTALYVPSAVIGQAGLRSESWFRDQVVTAADIWQPLVLAAASCDALEAQTHLLAGLRRLARFADRPPRPDRRACTLRVRHAVDYLHARFDRTVTVGELSSVSGLSPRHVIRSFQAATGLPPHAYQRQLRVERARSLLVGQGPRAEPMPLAEIALVAGFADQAHLTKAFKKVVGTTPGRYRRDVAGAPAGPWEHVPLNGPD